MREKNSYKSMFGMVLGLALMLVLGALQPAVAGGATYDLTGTWSFTASGFWVKGMCPAGKPGAGQMKIEQTGDTFTLEILSGMVCRPASMCRFSGTVNGAEYVCSNSDKVDDEGGVATNTVKFTASADGEAAGKGASQYKHPSGFVCDWGYDFSMTK